VIADCRLLMADWLLSDRPLDRQRTAVAPAFGGNRETIANPQSTSISNQQSAISN
jgi:hypothetical protein